MASHVAHVYYGRKYFKKFGKVNGWNWDKFLIGSLFPDIRRLAKISRGSVHFSNTSLNEIPENSFQAGLYIHSFIDERQLEYFELSLLPKIMKWNTPTLTALKFIEDALLYKKVTHWNEIAAILNKVLPEEHRYVANGVVPYWHSFLQEYFTEGPNKDTWRKNIEISSSKENAENIVALTLSLRTVPKVVDIIERGEKEILKYA